MLQVSQEPLQLLSLACAKMIGMGDAVRANAIQVNFAPTLPVSTPNSVKIYPASLSWSSVPGDFTTLLTPVIPSVFADSPGYAHTILIGAFSVLDIGGGAWAESFNFRYQTSATTPTFINVAGDLGMTSPYKSLDSILATDCSDGGSGGNGVFEFSGLIIRLQH